MVRIIAGKCTKEGRHARHRRPGVRQDRAQRLPLENKVSFVSEMTSLLQNDFFAEFLGTR